MTLYDTLFNACSLHTILISLISCNTRATGVYSRVCLVDGQSEAKRINATEKGRRLAQRIDLSNPMDDDGCMGRTIDG